MKKRLHFKRDPNEPGELVYNIFNKDEEKLGTIAYYSEWKKYTVDFEWGIFFDASCLKELINALEKLDNGEEL